MPTPLTWLNCGDPDRDLYFDLCDDDKGEEQPLFKTENHTIEQKLNQSDVAPETSNNQFKAMNKNQPESGHILQQPISEEEKEFILHNQPRVLIQKLV